MNSSVLQAIVTALNGSPALGTVLAGVFHTNASNQGLDVPNKRMTTTYVTNNPTTAPILEAEGFTVVIG
jgi:hypothetical protein